MPILIQKILSFLRKISYLNTLENGLVVKVPLFITEGESIKISTSDGKYVSRS